MSTLVTQSLLDKISDEFQSTFSQVEPGVFANMFFEREIPQIESLFKKHCGDNVMLKFLKGEEVADNYYIWTIEVKKA